MLTTFAFQPDDDAENRDSIPEMKAISGSLLPILGLTCVISSNDKIVRVFQKKRVRAQLDPWPELLHRSTATLAVPYQYLVT